MQVRRVEMHLEPGREVLDGDTAVLELQRLLEGAALLDRRLTDGATGDLHVLLTERGDHFFSRHAERGDPLGIEPHAHGIFTGSECEDRADTLDARQYVPHVQQRIVGDVDLIVGLVWRDHVHDEEEIGRVLAHRHAAAPDLVG